MAKEDIYCLSGAVSKLTNLEELAIINGILVERERDMELQQLCLDHIHPHDLIFHDQQVYNYGEDILCFMCLEPLMDGGYYCTSDCYFFVHKACTELPVEIHHPSHRIHPLILVPNSPYDTGVAAHCDFCGLKIYSFLYNCSNCDMDLHLKCAILARCFFDSENQKHRFVNWNRYDQFTCDFCGTCSGGNYVRGRVSPDIIPWICTECHVVVHKKCILLPRMINIRHHHHPLIHTFLILETQSVDLICGICCGEVKREFGCYCCQNCAYFVHVKCAKSNEIDEAKVDMDNEIEIGEEEELAEEIEHFSHPHHKLALVHHHDHRQINQENNKWKCKGCMSLILSAPFYACIECHFVLHITCCTKLPKQINHPLHQQHSLTFYPNTENENFFCVACAFWGRGFMYRCHTCRSIKMDVRCALANPYEFIHDSHEHPLCVSTKLYSDSKDPSTLNCCACCGESKSIMLRCKQYCPFSLDYRCATLPLTVKCEYDKHGLVLTYHGDEESDYFHYCDICEQDRDTKLWFYSCPNSAECPWYAHLECALGDYPYIKHGSSDKQFQSDIWSFYSSQ